MRYSVLISALIVVVLASPSLEQSTAGSQIANFPYRIQRFVREIRRRPSLFIGGWALKKFIKLKLIKLKFKVKKFLIKKTIKAAVFFALLKKVRRRLARTTLFNNNRNRRQKRQLEDLPLSPEELNEYLEYYDYPDVPRKEPADDEMLAYLSMANEIDTQGCLPKGVCEVVAKGNGTHLNHFENMVYDVYGDGARPVSPQDSPLYIYEYAAYIGKTSRDPRSCDQAFKSCSEQRQNLNNFMESTFTSETCDYPDDQIQVSNRLGFYTEPPPGFKFDPDYSPDDQYRGSRDRLPLPRKTGSIKFEN